MGCDVLYGLTGKDLIEAPTGRGGGSVLYGLTGRVGAGFFRIAGGSVLYGLAGRVVLLRRGL